MKTGTMRSLLLVAGVAAALPALAQQGDGTDVEVNAAIFKPNKVQPTEERLSGLRAPEGFTVKPFASGLGNARILAVSDQGYVYVSRRDEGDVLLLKDEDGDGIADGPPVQVATRPQAHGLAIADGQLYLATVKEVFVAPIQPDGRLGPLKAIIDDLPDAGQHPNRTIAFGPDGMLYISVGSTCNACNESNPENATLLRATPDGKSRTIFASGLRNTIGFDWSPVTGELWGLDHGIDFLGNDVQLEELNRLVLGKQYGWPHVFGSGEINPQTTPPGGVSKDQWREVSEPMVIGYTAHAAPMQLVFYTGRSFPADYAGDAFATMRGSWNRKPASGYEISRIRFDMGEPRSIEPFVTGFLTDDGTTHIARPVGLAVARDGSLLMADDANGVIYRVAYQGSGEKAVVPETPPAEPMQKQAAEGTGVPLAKDRPETVPKPADRTLPLVVMSASFTDGGDIPLRHSEYAEGVSPKLSWTAVPGAVSYAIVMEDPDAKPITPFVHWVAWNIPANVTSLPEGLQEQMRLTEPEGVLQGRNSSGTHGYFGPKPPAGDPPHRYQFQVLALDTPLDLPPTADRDAMLAAAEGHVLAKGLLIGRFAAPPQPPK